MPEITSLVFFDIETTGLPFQEQNYTKIIEFSFVAAQRKDLEGTPYGHMPPVSKLTFVLNPEKPICREVTKMTGLSRKQLSKEPTFKEKVNSVISFLEGLPGPVCLVSHNGNAFDFKILLAECNDISVCLPDNIYCVDSLVGFRSILKNTNINYSNLEVEKPVQSTSADYLITDDEDEVDEWQDLDLSNDDWVAIDEAISLSFDSDIENRKQPGSKKVKTKRTAAIKKVFKEKPVEQDKENFKLTTLYKRLLNKDEENAHRAEADCLMLLQCVVALKKQFLPWADENCKLLNEIYPLVRGATYRCHYRKSR